GRGAGAVRLVRRRGAAAWRASSGGDRRHRERPASGRRRSCRPPVCDRDGDRLRPVKKKPAHLLSREAEAFIEMLSAERGASKNTEAAYRADLKDLESFLARRRHRSEERRVGEEG